MGWLYQDDPVDDPLAYLKDKYNYKWDTHTLQTLDGARVGNTVYLAVRSTLRYVNAVSAFTCSRMRPDGFGGMAVVITGSAVMSKSTSDIVEEFLNEAVPGWDNEPNNRQAA